MIANDITLNVDQLNDGNTVAEAYELSDRNGNRSVYVGESHALDARDTITFYRTFPTPHGNFKGVAKSSAKLTEDVQVTGKDGVSTLTAPMIREVSYSFPIGVSAADVLRFRQRGIALEDNDGVMDDLNLRLLV